MHHFSTNDVLFWNKTLQTGKAASKKICAKSWKIKQIKAKDSNNGKNYNKEKLIFTTTSLHHTTLVLICIRFTCPRCYSEGQENRLEGEGKDKAQLETSWRLLRRLSCSLSTYDTQVKLTYQAHAFLAQGANYIGYFLNIACCDFSSSVWFGGDGCPAICLCARVTSHTHTTVYITLSNDERPDLRCLSFSITFCLTQQPLRELCETLSIL